MGFPTIMPHTAASCYGADRSKNLKKLASNSSSTSGRATRSRFTGTSHLAHLVSFPAETASGYDSPRYSRSSRPVTSSSRRIMRQDPVEVNSATSFRPPLHGEHVTYHTNDLGLFEDRTNDPLFTEAQPTLSNLFPHTSGAQRQLQGYQITGGWTLQPDGTHTYVPTGNIQEIPDEEDEEKFLRVGILDDSQAAFQMLPPNATPPPRPQAGICLLPPNSVLTPYHSSQALVFSDSSDSDTSPSDSVWHSLPQSSPVPHREAKLKDAPPPVSPFDIPGVSEGVSEGDLYGFAEFLDEEPIVRQNLGSIKRLSDSFTFLAPSREDQGRCKLLVNTLKRVKESLCRGLLIPNELWKFLNGTKRARFRNRMLSLRRTLMRLERVSTQLTFLRTERLVDILSKLSDHHKKLTDIASKLDATFELLDLCSLHETALISKRHSTADLYLKARESYLCKKPSRPIQP